MNETEDRLRALGGVIVPPPSSMGALRRRVRRRRLRLAGSGIGLVMAVVAGAVISSQTQDDTGRLETVDEPTDTDPGPGVTVERLSENGVPAVLLATSGNEFGIAVSDLDAGYQATYPDGTHTGGNRGALAGAVLTPGNDLVLWWSDRPALAYPAGRLPDGRNQLIDGGLRGPGRELGGIIGERTIVATDSGDAVWILASGDESDKVLQLVDLESGDVRTSTTVPPGSRLVDTIDDDAIVHPNMLEPSTEVLVVSRSGDVSTIPAPEPARLVAVTPSESVWIAGGDPQSVSGDRLLVVPESGPTVSIPAPEEGSWVRTGAPTIPSNSPTFPTLTPDDTRLLVALTDPDDPNQTANRVVVVDLSRQEAEAIYQGTGASSAFWASDGRNAVVIGSDGPAQIATAIDSVSGSTTTFDDAVPPGFFVIAAR